MEGYERRYMFFEGYYRAMEFMSDEQELEFRRSLDRFAFDGEEPEFDDPMLSMAWNLVITTLKKSLKLSEAGRKGGRGNKKVAFVNPLKPEPEGFKGGLKGTDEALKPPFNEVKGREVKGNSDDRDATLERMYSQSVKVVPIDKEAL